MKKTTFTALFFVMNFTAFAEDSSVQTFSEKAQELIDYYRPIPAPRLITGVTYRPDNKEKYYTDEYYPAWVELYQDGITNNFAKHNFSIYGIASVLSKIASTNSIPMFVNVYTQLLEVSNEINQKHQQEIIKILLSIDSSEAMDTVFSLLDLTETKQGIDLVVSLREMIINDLEKAQKKQEWIDAFFKKTPNATINENSVKELEMASKRQERFNNYQNSNLSERNQVFLQKARSLKRAQEGQNSD